MSMNSERSSSSRCLVIPGPFLPYNDTITQLVYKQLRLLPMDYQVCALEGLSSDPALEKIMKEDPEFRKFHITYTDQYQNVLFFIHNINLFRGLRHMNSYLQAAESMYSGQEFIYSSCWPCYTARAAARIKKAHPEAKWIASFSDPINHSPYKFDEETYRSYSLPEKICFRLYLKYYVVDEDEASAFELADLLVFIDEEQRDFQIEQYCRYFHRIPEEEIRKKCVIVPLNYIPEFNLMNHEPQKEPVHQSYTLSHFGRIYGLRVIEQFLYAFSDFRKDYPDVPVTIEQYGEFRKSDLKLIRKLGISECFRIHGKIPYAECIRKMQESDGVLLFDTILPENQFQPYLPSKILEYSYLKKNVLAVTTRKSPAYRIMKKTDAIACRYDRNEIYQGLVDLIINHKQSRIDYAYTNAEAIQDLRQRIESLK